MTDEETLEFRKMFEQVVITINTFSDKVEKINEILTARLIPSAEAGEILGIDKQLVNDLVKCGKLRGYVVPGAPGMVRHGDVFWYLKKLESGEELRPEKRRVITLEN